MVKKSGAKPREDFRGGGDVGEDCAVWYPRLGCEKFSIDLLRDIFIIGDLELQE